MTLQNLISYGLLSPFSPPCNIYAYNVIYKHTFGDIASSVPNYLKGNIAIKQTCNAFACEGSCLQLTKNATSGKCNKVKHDKMRSAFTHTHKYVHTHV